MEQTNFVFIKGGCVQFVTGPSEIKIIDFDNLEDGDCQICFGEIDENSVCQYCHYDWKNDEYLDIISGTVKYKLASAITDIIELSGEGLLNDEGVDPNASRALAEEIAEQIIPYIKEINPC